ncbi:hypothetical protein [Mastigocoleus sp. MO_188.B34]|uniref:hypothetical protein n=1 Tax=Mastigocoleus sp. MO_188.B34 TaxID=3036635 RepID=UPI00263A2CCD|nr:hypothetical protein [Mastigocoleus sp. MO_188.B34]MDJ0697896.1 hypothetical protein [Mastigocoleus sp. MO_188.B34]
MSKKKSDQSQPDKQEILELKPASSSQTEQTANSSDEVDKKAEIIELEPGSSSQTEPQDEKQQLKSTTDNQEPGKIPKPKPAIKLKKSQKKESSPPPYKNLETATNQNGETFAVGEKIKINTCNFGEYTVEIKFLYETADGSIWVTYYPFGSEDQKHPWRRGCQRLELLRKSDSQENSTSDTDTVSQKSPDSVPAD